MTDSSLQTAWKLTVPWYKSLIVQSAAIIIFAATAVLVSNTFLSYSLTLNSLEKDFEKSETAALEGVIQQIDQVITEHIYHLETFSNSHTPKHFFTELRDLNDTPAHPLPSVVEDLHNVAGSGGTWKRIELVDTAGVIRATTNPALDNLLEATPAVPSPTVSHSTLGTTKVFDQTSYSEIGQAILVIAEVHAWSEDGNAGQEVVGYVYGYLSPKAIFSIMQPFLKNSFLKRPGYFFVANSVGDILFEYGEGELYEIQHTSPEHVPTLFQSLNQNIQTSVYTRNAIGINQVETFVTYARSKGYEEYRGFNWVVVMETDPTAVRAFLHSASLTQIKFYVPAVLFAAFLVFIFVTYFFALPLSRITKHLEKSIVSGDLSPITFNLKGEMGKLVYGYNQFIKKIEERTTSLTNKIEEAEKLNKELESTKTATLNVLEDLDEEKRKVDEIVELRTKELVSERQKLMHITENMFVGVILTDDLGKPVFVNQQGKRILGIGDNVSNAIIRLQEKFPSPEVAKLLKKFIQGKSTTLNEIENEDGIFEIMGRCDSLQKNTDQEFIGKGIWIRNITEQKQLERSKSELVAVASHQLRTPLTVTRGNIEMLLDNLFGKITKKQRELLSDSQESVIRLIEMVNDMLDITKIEKGDTKLLIEELDIRDPIQTTVTDLEDFARRNKFSIIVHTPKQPLMVQGDKSRLIQIFQNLIGNAIRYGRENGKVEISFSKSKKMLKIEIADNGIGIPLKEQGGIFQRFYRASNAVKTTTGGSGLGLYIVRSFVEQMKGTITFSSKEGEGTTFIITLPLAVSD